MKLDVPLQRSLGAGASGDAVRKVLGCWQRYRSAYVFFNCGYSIVEGVQERCGCGAEQSGSG